MLKSAGPKGISTQEFLQAYIPRFSSRINELRNQGLDIETRKGKGTCRVYVLKYQPVFTEKELSQNASQLSFS